MKLNKILRIISQRYEYTKFTQNYTTFDMITSMMGGDRISILFMDMNPEKFFDLVGGNLTINYP